MTYRCGLSPGLAAAMGAARSDPHVVCDGCGLVCGATRPDGRPYAWLLDGRAPRGWAMVDADGRETRRRRDGEPRRDLCPRCRSAREEDRTDG